MRHFILRKCDSNSVHNYLRIKHHNSLKHCVISSLTSGKQKGVDSIFASAMWLYFVLLFFNFGYIWTFNVDTESKIILKPNGDEGLFGHSISVSEDGDTIVGAPISQTHGNVFLCRNVNEQSSQSCNKLGK